MSTTQEACAEDVTEARSQAVESRRLLTFFLL